MFIKVKRIESFIGMYSPMKIKINGEVIDKIKVKQEKESMSKMTRLIYRFSKGEEKVTR